MFLCFYKSYTRFPLNAGITGYVAATGDTVNLADPYQDTRFDKAGDENTNFKHSTILAMPIRHSGSPGRVQGVFLLVNKELYSIILYYSIAYICA